MLSSNTLFEMSKQEITMVDPAALVGVGTVTVSQTLPHEQKVRSVMAQLGNPYCFLSGNTPVRMRFVGEENTLSECLIRYFSQLKRT
jgi:hypothetical protein